MEKMKDVKVSFVHFYLNCNNWKPKETMILRNIIGGSRLNDVLRFADLGVIAFDDEDTGKRYPIINETDETEGRNFNAIVYDIVNKNCGFDKLVLYQTVTKSGGFYGYVAYNTKTKKHVHKFNIPHEMTELMLSINRFFVNKI